MCGMSMSTEVENYQRLEQLMNGIALMPDLTSDLNKNPYDIQQEIAGLSNSQHPEKNPLSNDYLLTVCHIEDENSDYCTFKKYGLQDNSAFRTAIKNIFWREASNPNGEATKFGPKEIIFIDEHNEQFGYYPQNIFRVYFICHNYPFNDDVMDEIKNNAKAVICLSNDYVGPLKEALGTNQLNCGVFMPFFEVNNQCYNMQNLENVIIHKFANFESFWGYNFEFLPSDDIVKDDAMFDSEVAQHYTDALINNFALINKHYLEQLSEGMKRQLKQSRTRVRNLPGINYLTDIETREKDSTETMKCDICRNNRIQFSRYLHQSVYCLKSKHEYLEQVEIDDIWSNNEYGENRQSLYGIFNSSIYEDKIRKKFDCDPIKDGYVLRIWHDENPIGRELGLPSMEVLFNQFIESNQYSHCSTCKPIDSKIRLWRFTHEFDTYFDNKNDEIIPFLNLEDVLFWQDNSSHRTQRKLNQRIIENNIFRIQCSVTELLATHLGGA